MPLAAGRLRHRVDIMRATQVDNGKGGYVTNWSAVDAAVPAEVIAQPGVEVQRDKALVGVRHYRVTLRYRTDVQPKDQLRYGTDDLNIRSAIDPDGRRQQLVIVADTDGAIATA